MLTKISLEFINQFQVLGVITNHGPLFVFSFRTCLCLIKPVFNFSYQYLFYPSCSWTFLSHAAYFKRFLMIFLCNNFFTTLFEFINNINLFKIRKRCNLFLQYFPFLNTLDESIKCFFFNFIYWCCSTRCNITLDISKSTKIVNTTIS